MVDRGRALALLDVAERHAAILDGVVPRVYAKYESDALVQLATERALHVAIESLMDLAALHVSARRLGLPSDERGVVDRLQHAGVLDGDHAKLLGELRRFRNVLVHQYGNLDPRRVHAHALRAPEAIRSLATVFRAALAG